ncbi:MAG TPA: hypothetical protein VMF89_00260 [Polyangiales bacterium]|nr:hypothetical protein [Polyangiales bacterium]
MRATVPALVGATACAATLLVATLSWYGIESPAIHWGRRLSDRRALRLSSSRPAG